MIDRIRPATSNDTEQIIQIFSECANWLSAQNMHHWLGYHNKKWVSEALKNYETFIYQDKELAQGVLMFREGKLAEVAALGTTYSSVADFNKEPFRWISKIAVRPSNHKSGIGSSLLSYAEEGARLQGYETCVLDAVTKNTQLLDYYIKRGYKKFGTHHDCTFFEKTIYLSSVFS